MFVVGILASRFHWLERISKATGILSLLIGCLLALGIYLRDGGEWNNFVTEWFGIYESLLCVFICFGLLWLFREYGNWSNKFWQWCAAQAYGAYIVHLLLMIALQNAVDGIWMGRHHHSILRTHMATAYDFWRKESTLNPFVTNRYRISPKFGVFPNYL